MDNPAKFIRASAVLVSGAYALVLFISGIDLGGPAKQLLGYLPSLIGLVAVAFDLWLWRLPGIHALVGRPRVGGAWLGSLTPHPDSHIPEGGIRGPITAALVIEQTYWSLSVCLMTAESSSLSTAAAIRRLGESRDRHVLAYTYANEPEQTHRPRSMPHAGASRLTLVGRSPLRLSGDYWTDRLTKGGMDFTFATRDTQFHNLAEVTNTHGAPPAPEQAGNGTVE